MVQFLNTFPRKFPSQKFPRKSPPPPRVGGGGLVFDVFFCVCRNPLLCDEKKKTKKEEGRAFVAPFAHQLIRGKADTTNEQRGAAKTEDRDDNKEHHTASMVRTWQMRDIMRNRGWAQPRYPAHTREKTEPKPTPFCAARHGHGRGPGKGVEHSLQERAALGDREGDQPTLFYPTLSPRCPPSGSFFFLLLSRNELTSLFLSLCFLSLSAVLLRVVSGRRP